MNPRIQVEHTVTECATGIDLVKAQIRIAGGARIGTPESGVPPQDEIRISAHALQCRVTTEDPENNFVPDYGAITAYRSPAGFGIRLDAGTAYGGAIITRSYDSLLVKVTAWAPTPEETIARMHRALWEFRIRGVVTNLRFLRSGHHASALRARRLHHALHRRDAGAVPLAAQAGPRHAHPDLHRRRHRQRQPGSEEPRAAGALPRSRACRRSPLPAPPPGTKQKLDELGPEALREVDARRRSACCSPTRRCAMRTSRCSPRACAPSDLTAIAPRYASLLPQLFSMECWGGATFDVAMRFLKEDPWQRLAQLRERMPNLLLQMLLRSANAVGYTNYPDNVVRFFVKRAAERGIDVFRIFDSLNWVENMRVAIDAVLRDGQAVRGGHLLHRQSERPAREEVHARLLPEAGARAEGRRHAHPGHQGHGGPVPAARRLRAGEGAEGGDRPAGALPHARHERHRRGQRAGGHRRRRGRRRWRDGCDERPDLAAESRLDRRGAALRPARYGRRSGERCA